MRRLQTALLVIALSNMLWTLGFRLWEAVFTNFAVQELHFRADQIGWIQSIREIPGLLGVLSGVVALLLGEMRASGLSVIVMGAGIALTAPTRELGGVIAATLVMSTGFHFFYAGNASAVLLLVGPNEAPKVLGRLNSLGALAALLGTLFILTTLEAWGFRTLFLVAGLFVLVIGVVLLPWSRQQVRAEGVERPRPRLRRRYALYYVLQFLLGSRRHIFTTFAVFLMVRQYGVPTQVMALLYLTNYLLGTYFHQVFGRLVARFGERPTLTANFILLALIFLGYAFLPLWPALEAPTWQVPALGFWGWVFVPAFDVTPVLLILMFFFITDNILFGFSIALECYFQKIALSPEEITPNIAMGQTMNHVAAVIIPVMGGMVWETVGPQYTFLAGVAIALLALGLTQRMRVSQPAPGCPVAEIR